MWAPLAKFIDLSVLSLVAATRPNYLRDDFGPPEHSAAELLERWQTAEVDLNEESIDGRVTRYDVRIRGAGQSHETVLYHERWVEPTRRLMVYHHGLGEFPPNRSFKRLFGDRRDPLPADRVLMVGVGHVPGRRDLRQRLARIDGFVAMLGCSVAVAKAVADRFGDRYDRMVLGGMSLGGIISMIETMHEPRFTCNVSLAATPFIAGLLVKSSLSRLVDSRYRVRVPHDALRTGVDIDEHVGNGGGRLVMINGRHDTMVDIERLRPWWAARPGIETHEISASHLSLAVAPGESARTFNMIVRRELGIVR